MPPGKGSVVSVVQSPGRLDPGPTQAIRQLRGQGIQEPPAGATEYLKKWRNTKTVDERAPFWESHKLYSMKKYELYKFW